MARYAPTASGTIQIAPIASGSSRGNRSRSYGIIAAAGTLLLERSTDGTAPDMTNAARVDFSRVPALTYTLEPGVTLWAMASSGTINVDVLRDGTR